MAGIRQEDADGGSAERRLIKAVGESEIDGDAVGRRRVLDRVDAGAAIIDVVTAALSADDGVVAAAGIDDVVAAAGVDRVVTGAGDDEVGAGAGGDVSGARAVERDRGRHVIWDREIRDPGW